MKRWIKSADSTLKLSQCSFDFISNWGYNERQVGNLVHEAFIDSKVYPKGVDFRSVDYSTYPEYRDDIISQCGVDFAWYDDYDEKLIEDNLTEYLIRVGIVIIGISFESLED